MLKLSYPTSSSSCSVVIHEYHCLHPSPFAPSSFSASACLLSIYHPLHLPTFQLSFQTSPASKAAAPGIKPSPAKLKGSPSVKLTPNKIHERFHGSPYLPVPSIVKGAGSPGNEGRPIKVVKDGIPTLAMPEKPELNAPPVEKHPLPEAPGTSGFRPSSRSAFAAVNKTRASSASILSLRGQAQTADVASGRDAVRNQTSDPKTGPARNRGTSSGSTMTLSSAKVRKPSRAMPASQGQSAQPASDPAGGASEMAERTQPARRNRSRGPLPTRIMPKPNPPPNDDSLEGRHVVLPVKEDGVIDWQVPFIKWRKLAELYLYGPADIQRKVDKVLNTNTDAQDAVFWEELLLYQKEKRESEPPITKRWGIKRRTKPH
eukprot:TRINITY_DN10518_c0_g1_i9.p1 TRINITY_DN10518_c0_g1~~TRINITY_DN10518_c0_g1_i9.p1  ORF type:complete len:374 (+),score=42.15 TRINITY_DN10518_c0_g1_i9:665-1786(+)